MQSFYFYLIFYNSLEKMMIQGLAHRDPASWHLKKISESHSEQALQDKMGHHNVSYFFFTKFYKLLRTKTVPQVIRILRIFFQLSFSLTKKKKKEKSHQSSQGCQLFSTLNRIKAGIIYLNKHQYFH